MSGTTDDRTFLHGCEVEWSTTLWLVVIAPECFPFPAVAITVDRGQIVWQKFHKLYYGKGGIL